MTCVVGVRTVGGVLLAADSQMSWENGNRMTRDAKTVQLSDLLAVAYCGSGRLGQILQYHLDELDDPPLGRDEHRWAVKDFIPFLREAVAEQGHLSIDLHDDIEGFGNSAFLFGVRGRLFTVEGDFSVSEHRYGFDALGTGMETAIGAMRATARELQWEPYPRAKATRIAEEGILAATDFTNFVGGDITWVETADYTDDERELAKTIAGRRR